MQENKPEVIAFKKKPQFRLIRFDDKYALEWQDSDTKVWEILNPHQNISYKSGISLLSEFARDHNILNVIWGGFKLSFNKKWFLFDNYTLSQFRGNDSLGNQQWSSMPSNDIIVRCLLEAFEKIYPLPKDEPKPPLILHGPNAPPRARKNGKSQLSEPNTTAEVKIAKELPPRILGDW